MAYPPHDELYHALSSFARGNAVASPAPVTAAPSGVAASSSAAPAPAGKASAAKGASMKAQKKAEKEAKMAAALEERLAKAPAKSVKRSDAVKPKGEYKNPTPPGQMKDMSQPMDASYQPQVVEAAWNAWWEKEGFFRPDVTKAKAASADRKFIMVIPPPNVTGSLHLGHTLTTAIEDCLCRWHRMNGNVALWVPGCDHAGIATQSVVERLLYKEEGKTRHDLGRDKFLERVWDWKGKFGARIYEQFRRIAASVDWSREHFTMDDQLSKAVTEAFVRFYDQGLIYRSTRLVNWCPHLLTALSDLEVDYEDITGRTLKHIPGFDDKVEIGVMCHFKYEVKGSPGTFLTVATTRLETMLGDVAVAVHPEDARYSSLVGKELIHPFFADRKMIVIADTMVDPEFGTGCVKITPAHDPNDFEAGRRHNLPEICVFSNDGKIAEGCGEFTGQHRFKARRTVEEALSKKGLFVEKKPHAMRIGFCSRSKDIIEPMLQPQWWMDCKDLAKQSVDAVANGDLKIVPEFHKDTWNMWLGNIRDWCISRQLWWGHRIPAYRVVSPPQAEEVWVAARSEKEAVERAEKKLGVKGVKVEQDNDVLDTWFSSGLFPFSVFGWPDKTDDMDAFFPTSLLETGHDILFFWVARMVMMSIGLTGKLPFHTVYLHAMVRDAHGRKMSKSAGNVIDPLEVIYGCTLDQLHEKLYQGNLPEREIKIAKAGQAQDFPDGIPECGSDALRFGLLAYTSQGRNVNLDINKVVVYRQFCNKLWNATRFAMTNLEGLKRTGGNVLELQLEIEDRWILSRLAACTGDVNQAMKDYVFADAVHAAHKFWLNELCDVYLELIKPRMKTDADAKSKLAAQETLATCLDMGLRLLHPMLPFVTEELYQRLPASPGKCKSITIAPFPQKVPAWVSTRDEETMVLLQAVAKAMRSQVSSLDLQPSAVHEGFVVHSDASRRAMIEKHVSRIASMTRVAKLSVVASKDVAVQKGAIGGDLAHGEIGCTVHVVVPASNLTSLKSKLEKKLKLAAGKREVLQKKLAAPGYDAVPENIKQRNAESMSKLDEEIALLNNSVAQLG